MGLDICKNGWVTAYPKRWIENLQKRRIAPQDVWDFMGIN